MPGIASASRPTSSWKSSRQGKRNGAIEAKHTQKNWFHKFLWTHIDSAAHRVGYSARAIVKYLQSKLPQLFGGLQPGVVQRWIADGSHDWSARTKERVCAEGRLAGSGRVGALQKYPEVVKAATERMRKLRTSGVVVNVVVAHAILLSLIETKAPKILLSSRFRCSEVKHVSHCD
jgi:hypothetical protein